MTLILLVLGMGRVVSVRVPDEVKRWMDRLRGEVNWSREIREFIIRRIEEVRRRKVLDEVVEYIKTLPEAPRGTAERLVRGDRDSH